jgi:hypothetical protein
MGREKSVDAAFWSPDGEWIAVAMLAPRSGDPAFRGLPCPGTATSAPCGPTEEPGAACRSGREPARSATAPWTPRE